MARLNLHGGERVGCGCHGRRDTALEEDGVTDDCCYTRCEWCVVSRRPGINSVMLMGQRRMTDSIKAVSSQLARRTLALDVGGEVCLRSGVSAGRYMMNCIVW